MVAASHLPEDPKPSGITELSARPEGPRVARLRTWLGWTLPVSALALFLLEVRRFCGSAIFYVDDPFISMRYARHLVQNGELSFNLGDRVEGYSNFLLVILHALGFALRGGVPGPEQASDQAMAVVLVASIAQLAFVFSLARRDAGHEAEATAWYYTGILTAAYWPFAFWATAGLETPLEGLFYVGLVACTTWRVRSRLPGLSLAVAGVLLVCLMLVRFEGAVAAVAVALVLAHDLYRKDQKGRALALVASVVALTAAYHLWRVAYFGALMPNTFVAKATGGSLIGRLLAGVSYCGGWLGTAAGGIGLAVLAIAGARDRGQLRAALTAVHDEPVLLVASTLVLAKLLLVTWGGGDWMPGWRMLVPITPIVLFLFFRATLPLFPGGGRQRVDGWVALAFGVALLLCSRQASFDGHDGVPNEAGNLKKLPRGNLAMGATLERAFGGGTEEVAVGEAGLVPYAAPHVRFLDLFGLVDRDMARQPGGMHLRVHADYVIARAPIAVTFAHLNYQPPLGPYQYGQELLASAAFHRAYRRVVLGDEMAAVGWALYLRRDVDPASHGMAWAPSDALEEKAVPVSR
jgi:hypothetical protein